MAWLLLIILISFFAIQFIWARRALRVFSGSRMLRISGLALFVANAFVALTAVFGGITVAAGIDKFPADWLTGTVFSSYLIPGLVLCVVVGGSATVAAVATIRDQKSGAISSALAGGILLGWLVGERLILPPAAFSPQFWWLEAIYVAAGLVMVGSAVTAVWIGSKHRF